MKRFIYSAIVAASFLAVGCCQDSTPRAKHVIFLGFDAMSSVGIQRSETPNFNYLIENGAVSLDTRCCRETSSSENWFAMVSGAPLEVHGITTNDWEIDNYTINPPIVNKKGIFPTVFDAIRNQKPDARMEAYVEWGSMTRMFDMSLFDKAIYSNREKSYNADEILDAAFASYLENEPDFLFVGVDITDHAGHEYGHENQGFFDTVSRMDEKVGAFVRELEKRNMLKDAVIIITADHGGINFGHGGDSMAELQIPVIMYGKGVTKGKVMENTNMIYDNAATIAGLLGVKLPEACRGKFLKEAFEPKTNVCYVPVPLVHPFKGVVAQGEKVSITADLEGADIYYTLDGSTPTIESAKYEGPFELSESSIVKAVAYKNGNYGWVASNYLSTSVPAGEAKVQYKLYKNYYGVSLPDFTKFGRADAVGYVGEFGLKGLPVEESEDHFAVIFSSNLNVPETGRYKFSLSSDDGAKLIIDGKTVVNNDGSHTLQTVSGFAELEEGLHIMKVEYFEDSCGQYLEVHWGKAGDPVIPLMPSVLTK